MDLVIERIAKHCARTGTPKSSFYDRVAKGLMVKPFKLGPRSSGVPKHEADAILKARIAGVSDDEIRALVSSLMAARAA